MRKPLRFVLALFISLAALKPLPAESGSPVLEKLLPENVHDLRAIQDRVKRVAAKVMPCVVGIRIDHAAGSGVIVSRDGYVLTAGHISGKPDRDAEIILPDGKKLKGKTLGSNKAIDSGMIRITDEGEWPFVEMGSSAKLKVGAWCLALGHPEGFRKGRTPVLRLGRVLSQKDEFLRTDCALVGGDSGGPLFDLDGKVIGINSRIGEFLTYNLHVPVDTYRATWSRLAKGDVWGGKKRGGPYIGVEIDDNCRILNVIEGSPAEKAGLKANDVVLRFDKDQIEDADDLLMLIAKQKPGDEVSVRVRRGKQILNLKVIIGRHPA
ncbi:MAG TPA: trypsin-like peptidase domain-containing protein [Gemmataceae bacterium]|nr:trypsin-like peptidase domain-containing protein [Gemmataceae bacterium]